MTSKYKTAIVTGASQGIGAQIVQALTAGLVLAGKNGVVPPI